MKEMTLQDWFTIIPSRGLSPIESLYMRLDAMYPAKWRANFVEPDAVANWQKVWAEGFVSAGITTDMIKRGLDNCVDLYVEWPPTYPQFIKACKEIRSNEQRHNRPMLAEPEYIPCTPEEAAVHIANIRALIEKNGGILKNVTEELSSGN